ncbi:MAG: diguanylate cyclase [Candidatus Thiodiazotropha sp.]
MENKPTILIVDDEPVNIKLVADLLADQYTLKVALNGEQAIHLFETYDIELILLDIQLPDVDGYEVARRIRSDEQNSDVPIIFLTSRSDENSIVEGFEAGGNDYLTKPFNARELDVRVANHLNTYRLQKKVRQQEEFLSILLDAQPTMVIVTNATEVQFANRPLLEFFRCEDIDIFRKRYQCVCNSFVQSDNFFHMGKVGEHENWIAAIQELPRDKRVVSMISHQDFTEKAFSVSVNGFEDHYVVDFHDISETMLKQPELIRRVEHDALTQAYTREYFYRSIGVISKQHTAVNLLTALTMLDIDHFKRINDTYGHDMGDDVLKALVNHIQNTLRSSDVLIRWGGEEFLLVLGVKDEEALSTVLNNLCERIAITKMPIVGTITCSFGATLLNQGESIDTAIKRSDIALYESKGAGRNQVRLLS